MQEIVVNGIPYKETVLPTRMTSSSAYGLDLKVMDTPRNTTLLSTTQLETLNIQDPRAFSYLTSSSYTDSHSGPRTFPEFAASTPTCSTTACATASPRTATARR